MSLLLFDSSLVAEELEEKADLKARTAAPPLTPQPTVLFARYDSISHLFSWIILGEDLNL